MGFLHAGADGVHQWQDDQRGDRMADEGGDDEDQGGEDDQDAVQAHALHLVRDGAGDGVQEAGGGDGLAEGEAAGGEDDDGPEEVVEVFLGQDAGAEEEDERDDGHDAHVAKDVLELVRHAPQDDRHNRDPADEPLDACELVLHGPDRHDGGAFSRLEGDEEEDPDEEDGDDADGEGDEEPDAPARLRPHVLQGDYVLRGSDGGGGAADVGGQGDAENEGFGEVGVRRQIAEKGLDDASAVFGLEQVGRIYLNDRETQYWRCNVTDPHAENHSNEHVCN